MAETVSSPDGSILVDLSLRVTPGGEATALHGRVRLGRRVVVGWTRLGHPDPSGRCEVRRRTLRDREGRLLAEELAIGKGRSSCLIRIADDVVAILPRSLAVAPSPVFQSSSLVSASVPFGDGYAELTPGLFRKRSASLSPVFLSYRHGGEAVLFRDRQTGALLLVIGDGPASLLIPRGMRAVLAGLSNRLPLEEGPSRLAVLATNDAAYNVRYPFLVVESVLFELRRHGFASETFLDPSGLAPSRSLIRHEPEVGAGDVTECHRLAYELLTRPGAADAATGYRGESGEYLAGARRVGEKWIAAGFTFKPRVLTLFFPYLEEGVVYRADWQTDVIVEKRGVPDTPPPAELRAGDKAIVKMAESGGFAVTLTPMRNR